MNFIIKINMFYREKNKRRLTYQKVSYKMKKKSGFVLNIV